MSESRFTFTVPTEHRPYTTARVFNGRPRRHRSSLSYGLVPSQAEPVFGVSRRQSKASMVHIESLSPTTGPMFMARPGVTLVRSDGERLEIMGASAPTDAEPSPSPRRP